MLALVPPPKRNQQNPRTSQVGAAGSSCFLSVIVVPGDARTINAGMAFGESAGLTILTNYGDSFAQPSWIIGPTQLRQI
jgi:hypothetical protein